MTEIIIFALCASAMGLVGALNRKAHVEKVVARTKPRRPRATREF